MNQASQIVGQDNINLASNQVIMQAVDNNQRIRQKRQKDYEKFGDGNNMDQFHKEIDEGSIAANTDKRQNQDNFDPFGDVYWGSDTMGGIFESSQQE